ncbi:tetratricopeptide repeat-containing sulfotransferase family protein [Frateuria hangzhouensis]|uniref:tetratricopeptide repeat-containing sulfotransferase family protein n=1 Tax=Frateuria hangzhouensis TaxID=2995589 RepID=UPI0022608AE9|nr:tetratricopeptide repeat-containing sulfotransferase family protein [Frateuria sp. STR12]MCX7514857.1 sulfotransferase [Frateuria sp. STR12]
MATRTAGLSPGQVQRLEAAARGIRDGALPPAQHTLGTLLAEASEHPEALRLLGILHTRARQPDAAREVLTRALGHWPDDPLLLTDLGNAEQSAGDVETALAYWRRTCALAPDYPMGWFNLGRNLQVLGFTEPAIEALEHACAADAGLLPAHVLLGDALVHLGRFDEADRSYRAALGLHPACGDAWRGLANMKTRPLSATDRDRLAALLQRADLAETDRIAMGFALGKAREDQGAYAEAFAALGDANARQRRLAPWNAGGFHAFTKAVVAASGALPTPVDPTLGSEAIFIVGLPRSGSTLFEQILAAHPQVEGASELPDLGEVLAEESARRRQPFPQWVPAASAQDWQRLGQRYLERTERWRRQRPRFTDKLPENWLYSGVLAAMLPAARIVDARRDALEAGWSCFKQQFYRLPHFACTLTDIAAYVRDYEAAMDRWQAGAPARIRTQRYEALLADPEAEIRALLDFCGLPFDPACLDFHRAMRSVRTPSAAQVRQPLDRNTARAERYGHLLDPLRLGLGRPLAPR